MSYSIGPVIRENPIDGESYRDPLKSAPPEVVLEQLIRNNPEALDAMFENLGITDEDFAQRVKDRIEKDAEASE